MGRRLTCLTSACAAALLLAACTAAPDDAAAVRTPGPAAPSTLGATASPADPTASPADPTASPADPTAGPPPADATWGDGCRPLEPAEPGDPESVAGWEQQVPVDGGPRTFATGTAVLDDDGTPVAYTVAAGDVGAFVSERFCVSLAYLHVINQVRRSGADNLHPGDTINLDPGTILSVGDEGGAVQQNRVPSPIPPQR